MGTSDEQAITTAVESFLAAVGNYDLDAVEEMVAPDANVGWASLSEETWTTSTTSVKEWLSSVRSRVDQAVYTEPVMDWTIHVDGATLRSSEPTQPCSSATRLKRHNIDYFTLIKIKGEWKFLSLCYVGTPIDFK